MGENKTSEPIDLIISNEIGKIEPIDLIISKEMGRIEEKYQIAEEMAYWQYDTISMELLCDLSKEAANNMSSLKAFQSEIEKFKELEEKSFMELVKRIEKEKIKKEYYIRIAYNLFKNGASKEKVKKTTKLKKITIEEINELVKEEESIKYNKDSIEKFVDMKEIIEKTLDD